jgi:hypothetical protein
MNVSLLANGDFAQRAADGAADGWAPSSVAGFTCTGYQRVTAANATRRGQVASIVASTDKLRELAGASRRVSFTPDHTSMFETLVLSGWSRAASDANGTAQIDYSVYADVEYSDGTFSFGEAATFSAGTHDWEFASHAFRVAKPLKVVVVYAMYRNRIGTVYFSNLQLTGVPHAACMPRLSGTARPTSSPTGNQSVATLAVKVAPSSWNGTEAGVTATFEGLADHIRITGAVALSHPRPCPYPNPCPPNDAPADRAVSLQLAFPLAAAGWKLWSDAETHVVLPSRGNSSSTTSHLFAGQSENVAGLPHTIDRYPMLVLTSADGSRGVMLAVPMVPTVQLYRVQYDAQRSLLQITFEFGLTASAQRFPSMATFSCLLVPLAQPEWGFRSALDSYFSLHPGVFTGPTIVKDQGIWGVGTPPDTASIPGWRDFGLKFMEEATEWNVSQSLWMNENDVGIFPYVEPSNMHYCLGGVKHATWESVRGVIGNCSLDR